MPRIPAKYGIYDAFLERVGRPAKRMQVMAPNSRTANRFLADKYAALGRVSDAVPAYGPFYPSEERKMMNPAHYRAFEREVQRRKEAMWDDFMQLDDVETYDPKGLDRYFEDKAREEVARMVDNYNYRAPVLERHPVGRLSPEGQMEYYNAFNAEGVKDRLRYNGIPEEDFGWIEPDVSSMNRY